MRVLIIVPALPVNLEEIKGGVCSALSNLLRGFVNSEVEVRIISFNREVSKPLVTNYSDNITIHYTPESTLPHIYNFIFKGSAIIRKHIKEFNPSVVHYAMSGYILMTKVFGLFNKVQIVTIHGIPFLEARQKERIKEKLVWYSNGVVEWMLCPKNIIHLSNYSLKQFNKSKNCLSTIIPNAVNPRYFDIPLKNNTQNKLLYIGSIEANKNILFLLKALRILIEKKMLFTVNVLGDFMDEGYKAEVINFIKENGLESFVTFYGWVSQQKLQLIMTNSDILVVSSKQETLPMVIAEAMSAGKVVVASDVGGISEMVTHEEDGFVFDIADVVNVIPILERLYNNNAILQRMQTAARKKAIETYHCNTVAKKTIMFYRSFFDKKSALGILNTT
jgi:glycosyltransferase involved in cell wall biosynthesis